MNFYDGFAWAVPHAFETALSSCLFEEGDKLYDNKAAYELEWGEALMHVDISMRVREPARKSGGADGNVFEKNWTTPALVEILRAKNERQSEFVRTTQGRIYTVLWKGNADLLDDGPDPKCPEPLARISRRLRELEPAKLAVRSDPVFILPFDTTNGTSRQKHAAVRAALHKLFPVIESRMTPQEAGMTGAEKIAPTVSLIRFEIPDADEEIAREALKSALYKGSRSHFRLEAHGLLIA